MSSIKKVDYLLLLVGGNPLPVYVSALMLADEKTQVRLLHSPEDKAVRNVAELAQMLKTSIENTVGCKVENVDLNSIDRENIRREIEGVINQIPEGKTVGFNYTGGTKPMVVYSIRMLEEKVKNGLTLSYLNAQDKTLYVECGRRHIEQYPAKLEKPVPLEIILKLHGYKPNETLGHEAKFIAIANAIIEICQSDKGIDQWKHWWFHQLPKNQLPTIEGYPLLVPFMEALENEVNDLTPDAVANYFGFEKLSSCAHWLDGGWLEEYVFSAVKNLSTQCTLHDCGINLKPAPLVGNDNPKNFEIDVFALQNYQLFGISCIASKKENGEVKKHLFEAYMRARQLGGDEARVALVYLGDAPQAVQDEIDRTWLPSNALKVFGRNELPDLREYLYKWFTQNMLGR